MIGWLYTCLGERGFITADLFGKWRKIGGEESNYIKSSFLSTNKLKISDTSWSYTKIEGSISNSKTELYLGVCPSSLIWALNLHLRRACHGAERSTIWLWYNSDYQEDRPCQNKTAKGNVEPTEAPAMISSAAQKREIEYYQKVSSHAQIWQKGAEKQLRKVRVVDGWVMVGVACQLRK